MLHLILYTLIISSNNNKDCCEMLDNINFYINQDFETIIYGLHGSNEGLIVGDQELSWDDLAEDISNASDGRKSTGSFGTIYASYEDKNYISRFRLGDEISDVVTGREQTKLTLDGIRQQLGRPVPSPMIVRQRVTMTREGTQSTEFTLTHDINVVDAQTTIIRGKNETA